MLARRGAPPTLGIAQVHRPGGRRAEKSAGSAGFPALNRDRITTGTGPVRHGVQQAGRIAYSRNLTSDWDAQVTC